MLFGKERKQAQGEDFHNPIPFRKDLLAGSVVAVVSKMVLVPAEQVKLLQQARSSSKQIQADRQEEGMVGCFVCIPREQGFFSFWCGNWANVIQCFPTQALNFAFKGKYNEISTSKLAKEKQFFTAVPENFLATGVSGGADQEECWIIAKSRTISILCFFIAQAVAACSGMLSYPFDIVRRHIMMQ
ncbi:PREDICTED: ADP/ATP translocase 4-like, partial [Buceros rhinoceros silvestris]|uniref:ADP/ATP translocase 4-like n=1 Tax=Buceros rhinoceros silvestris TaxID=175836 RepID=UPI0005289CCC